PARAVRREPPPARPRETRVAQATPPPAPAPTPAPAPARKKDVLDFESNDAALDDALGGGSTASRRSVYVPPRPGGELPAKLSSAQINEAVAQRIDSLQRCMSEQKARDAEATGTLKMRWLINADGSVRDVKCLTPEFASGQFAQCLAGVVKSIKFPRSTTSGQEVTFPFRF
uniref:AgmX/PglI C-terminal domain-containing protein n=1 Tax=Anaeromyxobacter terrae TaxID=2925406 RepID=UPI001F587430